MRTLIISFLIIITVLLTVLLPEASYNNSASATHISKPVVTTNRTTYGIHEPIVLGGWVEYFGRPISDVLLDILISTQNGSIVVREELKSDLSGHFAANIMVPQDTRPGNYAARIISQCRDEHRDICSNQDATAPIILVKNTKKPNAVLAPNITTPSLLPENAFDASKLGLKPLNYSSNDNNTQNITCSEHRVTILGTRGSDYLVGTSSNDIINGLEGNDIIYIKETGNDHICAANGDDIIIDNGLGDNVIYGGLGNDIVSTFSNHTKVIDGQDGNDTLIDLGSSSNRNIIIYGGNNDDAIIDNGHGNNIIYGGIGNDVIHSNNGDNTIHGGYGNDTIFGSTGNNTIYGNEGYDIIDGGRDNEEGKWEGEGQTVSTIDGGPGFDSCKNARIIINCEQQ
jgi:hypothetical protein